MILCGCRIPLKLKEQQQQNIDDNQDPKLKPCEALNLTILSYKLLPSCRNQSIDLMCKSSESIDWFLYEGNAGT